MLTRCKACLVTLVVAWSILILDTAPDIQNPSQDMYPGNFKLIPYNSSCTFGTAITLFCRPYVAEAIFWTLNGTQINHDLMMDKALYTLNFQCEPGEIRCWYYLNHTLYHSPPAHISLNTFIVQPQNSTCIWSSEHYVNFNCIPLNLNFISIHWSIKSEENQLIQNFPSSLMNVTVPCSIITDYVIIQCTVQYKSRNMTSNQAVFVILDSDDENPWKTIPAHRKVINECNRSSPNAVAEFVLIFLGYTMFILIIQRSYLMYQQSRRFNRRRYQS